MEDPLSEVAFGKQHFHPRPDDSESVIVPYSVVITSTTVVNVGRKTSHESSCSSLGLLPTDHPHGKHGLLDRVHVRRLSCESEVSSGYINLNEPPPADVLAASAKSFPDMVMEDDAAICMLEETPFSEQDDELSCDRVANCSVDDPDVSDSVRTPLDCKDYSIEEVTSEQTGLGNQEGHVEVAGKRQEDCDVTKDSGFSFGDGYALTDDNYAGSVCMSRDKHLSKDSGCPVHNSDHSLADFDKKTTDDFNLLSVHGSSVSMTA